MKYRFFYHYNKPFSKSNGGTWWTVHYKKTCHIVHKITCLVQTETKRNNKQPVAVVQGFANNVCISRGEAIII